MTKLVEFRDACVVSRLTGRDEEDNPVREEIYSGPCLYEEGTAGWSYSLVTRFPTVFIPGNLGLVAINDNVRVTTESGRVIESTAKVVRDVNMPWMANIKVTRIELKQAKGD